MGTGPARGTSSTTGLPSYQNPAPRTKVRCFRCVLQDHQTALPAQHRPAESRRGILQHQPDLKHEVGARRSARALPAGREYVVRVPARRGHAGSPRAGRIWFAFSMAALPMFGRHGAGRACRSVGVAISGPLGGEAGGRLSGVGVGGRKSDGLSPPPSHWPAAPASPSGSSCSFSLGAGSSGGRADRRAGTCRAGSARTPR